MLPGRRAADVGVVGAVGREAEQRAVVRERRRDDGDVRQVGAAAVGVVQDPCDARLVPLPHHGLDGGGHRAEVDGDVLGLHDHPAGGVEQRAGRVAALLDVGRVRRADEHGAHLLARRAQGAGDHAQGDRVDAHGARSSRIVPDGSTRPAQPGGTASVASGQLADRRSGQLGARLRLAGQHGRLVLGAVHPGAAGRALRAPSGRPRRGRVDRRPRLGRGHPERHELDLALRVAVAVRALVCGGEGVPQRVGLGRLAALHRRARTPARDSAARP